MSSVDPIDRTGGGVNLILMLLPSCKGTFTRHVTVQPQPKEHSHLMLLFSHNQRNIHRSCYCSATTKGTFTGHVTVHSHNQRNIHRSCYCSATTKGTITGHVTVQPQPKEHSHVMLLSGATAKGTFTRHVTVRSHNQRNIHTSCYCPEPQPVPTLSVQGIPCLIVCRVNITTRLQQEHKFQSFYVRFSDDKHIIIIQTQNLWQTALRF